jgi:hypothetical protein
MAATFKAFLSHSSKDKARVREVKRIWSATRRQRLDPR